MANCSQAATVRFRRVPQRVDFLWRALADDLGERLNKERMRFAVNHPLACAMTPLVRNMVPLQSPREPVAPAGFGDDLSVRQRDTDAVQALGYVLGAYFAGICGAEP